MSDLVSIEMPRDAAADLLIALEALAYVGDEWAEYVPLIVGTEALRNGLHSIDMVDATMREMERRPKEEHGHA